MTKDIKVAFGTDVDAVGGWLGSYGGENSPDDISRGVFAGEVGVPRLLELFRRNDVKQTWFWPGHSIETFPSSSTPASRPATRSASTATPTRTRSPCRASRSRRSSTTASS